MINLAWSNHGAGWVAAFLTTAVGLAGIIATYRATRRTVEAARIRDSYYVRKEHREAVTISFAKVALNADFFHNVRIQGNEPEMVLSAARERMQAISDGMAFTPWAYPREKWEKRIELRNALLELELERKGQLDADGLTPAADSLPDLSERGVRLLESLVDKMWELHSWASDRLKDETEKYETFVKHGVPKSQRELDDLP